jgi:hypothetical protein
MAGESVLGKAFSRFVQRVRSAASRPVAAVPPSPQQQAQSMVDAMLRAGQGMRSVPDFNLGSYNQATAAYLPTKAATSRAMHSIDARYARVTSGAGAVPAAWEPQPEIVIPMIAQAHRRCYTTGYADSKAALDARQLQLDSHCQGLDRIRRSATYKAPFRINPAGSNPIQILTRNAVKAAWATMDGFKASVGELGIQALTGFSCAELVWARRNITIPVGKRSVTVESDVIQSMQSVAPRVFAFDTSGTDHPYLVLGHDNYYNIADDTEWLGDEYFVSPYGESQKFMFIRAMGDGDARFRGVGWANAWLSMLGNSSLEAMGTLVAVFGQVVPYLQFDSDEFMSNTDYAIAEQVIATMGTGKGVVIPKRLGTIDHSPTPTNIAPIHREMLSIVKGEQSKLWLSSTLQMETDGIGSNALGQVHRGQQSDVQNIDASLYAEAIRTQPFRYLVQANAEVWAAAFSRFVPGSCTPQQVIDACPTCEWIISDETPSQRLAVFSAAKTQLGLSIDEDQVREELGVRAPLPDTTFIGDEPPPAPLLPELPPIPPTDEEVKP